MEGVFGDEVEHQVDHGHQILVPAKTHVLDTDGNVTEGVSGKLFVKDTSGSIIYCDNPRKLLIARGLKDYLVIDTGDVLLICPKDDETLRDTSRDMKRPEFEEYRSTGKTYATTSHLPPLSGPIRRRRPVALRMPSCFSTPLALMPIPSARSRVLM